MPNPCTVCGVPIFGSMIGTGDGTMKNGGSFAHPECYWRDQAKHGERYREALAQIEEILFDDLANRPSERARKAVMKIVAKALYGQ